MASGAKNAFADEKFLGGKTDPRIAPGADAKRGAFYLLARPAGDILLLQKNDDGKTTNWTPYRSVDYSPVGISIAFGVGAGVIDIYEPRPSEIPVGVKVFVITPFSDVTSTLKIGTTIDGDDALMEIGDNSLGGVGIQEFESDNILPADAGNKIIATLDPKASVAGIVVVLPRLIVITGIGVV